MPVHRITQPVLAFRWHTRKQQCVWVGVPIGAADPSSLSANAPVVRMVENIRQVQNEEQLTNTFRELTDRQFSAMKQLLVEAKFKAEAMLRDDAVASDPGKLAYYAGWISYADYVLGSFETYREPVAPLTEE